MAQTPTADWSPEPPAAKRSWQHSLPVVRTGRPVARERHALPDFHRAGLDERAPRPERNLACAHANGASNGQACAGLDAGGGHRSTMMYAVAKLAR